MNNLEESSLAKLNTDSLINIILKLKNEYDIKINRMKQDMDHKTNKIDYLENHILNELDYKISCPCDVCSDPIKDWVCDNGEYLNGGYVCAKCDSFICQECARIKEHRDPYNIMWCSKCMENE